MPMLIDNPPVEDQASEKRLVALTQASAAFTSQIMELRELRKMVREAQLRAFTP
jgi:hypothetical protein